MTVSAFLLIVIAIALAQISSSRRGRSHRFLKTLGVGLVVSVLFAAFVVPQSRRESRTRTTTRVSTARPVEVPRKDRARHAPHPPAPPAVAVVEFPHVPPPRPIPDDDSADAAEPDIAVESEVDSWRIPDPRPLGLGADGPPPPDAHAGAQDRQRESLPARVADWVGDVIDGSITLAERSAIRAEQMRIRTEQIRDRVERRRLEITESDSPDGAEDPAWVESAGPDTSNPGWLPSRRTPRTVGTLVASTALLYLGYLFLDANTRGQFTWTLRIASVLAFVGIIVAAISLS